MKTTSALIALGLAAQQAAAHGHGWIEADSYSCPSNTDNHCDSAEESGFNWGGLKSGSSVDHYSGYNFKGYTCQDSFGHSKRNVLLSRGIQSKCIAGTASKDHESNPSFSCPDKSFSIDHVQVSTEEDQDLEFTYGYSNGGTCKHVASCSKSGSTIKNSQCGGADSVTVGVPKHAPKETCSFGIHSVGFNCGSASVPIPSSTIVPVVSSYVVPPLYTVPANSSGYATPTASASYPTAPASYPTAPVPQPSCTKGCSTVPIYSYSSPVYSYSSPIGTAPGSSSVPAPTPSSPSSYATGSSSTPISSESSLVPTSPESTPASVTTYPVSSGNSLVPTSPESTPSVATYPVETPSSVATYPVGSGSSLVPTSPQTTPASVVTYPAETPSSIATYPVSSGSSLVPTIPQSTPFATYPAASPSIPVSSSLGNSPTEAVSSHVPGVTKPVYTTEVVYTTLTTCPVTNTITTEGTTSYQTTTTVSTIVSTSVATVSCTKCPTEAVSSHVSVVTKPVYTTEVVYTTLTTCPVTNTITTEGTTSYQTTTTVSTIVSTSVATVSYTNVPSSTPEVVPSTSGNSPVPVSSASPSPSAPCPSVLPQCLNTWIKLTTCENNAASDCYCTNSEFTKNVQDCVSSWSYDDNEIQAALSYLAGICAPHVSANPGIVTHVPKTITLVPTPATSSVATPAPSGVNGVTAAPVGGSPSTPAAAVYQPATTISYSSTLTVPITYSTGASAGKPIPSSSTTTVISTAVTVPQVQLTTGNSPIGETNAPSVYLAAGSPAAVGASPTAVPYRGATPIGYGPTGASTLASVKQVPTAVSSPITPFEGVATKVGSGMAGIVIAGIMGLIILV